ncbi:MAG: GvpL/GvpF family gas vesicle protein [Candidatus Methanoperedens sp.]|nr:GvpL/GvpF family gas vesicle protein [Candidatus Methanoperedens sp.]
MSEAQEIGEGRYLYCIIDSGAMLNLGGIGIEDNIVYTIPHEDIAAVVHSCMANPYETKDNEKANGWILAHNYVIDCATKKFGTVLPFSFDTIVRGGDDTLKDWLSKSCEKLKGELLRVKNKAEYSVQIFCEHEKLRDKLAGSDEEIKGLKEKMEKMPKGSAYLFQRKFELKVKDALSAGIAKLADEFGGRIREHVEEIRVEEKTSQAPEKYRDKKLIAALTCMVSEDKVERLGEVLDEINKRDGFAVRFTGPWAPFSFVGLKEDL